MLKNALSDTVNWQTQVEELYKISSFCLDDHQFKQQELELVGELSGVCSQIVLTCLYLARIGRLDNLWSLNKLAGTLTRWTQACDMRLARLISFIHHTIDYGQQCNVGIIRRMCKKQTSVSHSSTESEIISLDAGLRMDGSLVLDLWDSN